MIVSCDGCVGSIRHMQPAVASLGVLLTVIGLVISLRGVAKVRRRVDDDEFRGARDAAWDRFAPGTGLSAGMALLGGGVLLVTLALVVF
jgi:hypothetical protein